MERKALDSCGSSGTGETPQERKRRGGSPHAPRKASAWSANQPLLVIMQQSLRTLHNKKILNITIMYKELKPGSYTFIWCICFSIGGDKP
ncbi:hypothetical protein [Bacillus persicus]|uniref:hypothetical protein n=1 Tax=Mesobacillus persicus TaxID=930146 RepID=UPI000B80674D